MENFPSNSREARVVKPDETEPPEDKKILKVVEGPVARRKKPLGTRFMETFFSGDGKSVIDYVVQDVMLPAFKDMITDALSQGFERMIYGESRPAGRRSSSRPTNYTSYGTRYGSNGPPRDHRSEPRNMSRRARATHDFDEVILSTRAEAEEVIDQMRELVEKYGTASIADFYATVGIDSSHTDEKWGWMTLIGSGVTRVSGGYLLNLPKPEPID